MTAHGFAGLQGRDFIVVKPTSFGREICYHLLFFIFLSILHLSVCFFSWRIFITFVWEALVNREKLLFLGSKSCRCTYFGFVLSACKELNTSPAELEAAFAYCLYLWHLHILRLPHCWWGGGLGVLLESSCSYWALKPVYLWLITWTF